MSVAGYLHGKPCCSCVLAWWPAFELLIGRSVPIIQAIGDAPASAGFHEGGGSVDCAPLSEAELRAARNCGAAAWNRWWTGNFHAHLRLNGCTHNSIGQPQVADLNAGRDGTGPLYDNTGEPDNGPRNGVHWPLRTWREGIEWATTQLEDIDMAAADDIIAHIDLRATEIKRRIDTNRRVLRLLVTKVADQLDDNDRAILAELDKD